MWRSREANGCGCGARIKVHVQIDYQKSYRNELYISDNICGTRLQKVWAPYGTEPPACKGDNTSTDSREILRTHGSCGITARICTEPDGTSALQAHANTCALKVHADTCALQADDCVCAFQADALRYTLQPGMSKGQDTVVFVRYTRGTVRQVVSLARYPGV